MLVFVSGGLFGTGLAISGMTNPERVLGFLDVTGRWDPTLAFVMAGAVSVFALGSYFLRRQGSGVNHVRLASASSGPISFRLITGAAIFGIGWGLAGFCPGPSLASLAALRPEALVFVPTMALGMIVAQRLFGADRS
ncbi:MAG: DUF6691 family protein [Verrucomicrobiota bacterium]